MTSENNTIEQNDTVTVNDLVLLPKMANEDQSIELNNRIKTDFMSYCFSFLNEDEESRHCVQTVWNKYLQCVGDVVMLSAFFDTLPFHIKKSVVSKYQDEIIEWCANLFHIHFNALLCSTYYSETFQRVIRYALRSGQFKKAIIYIPIDFDPNLKTDLTSSLPNIKFEHIPNGNSHEDMISIKQLEEAIKRDVTDTQSYPFMVIANAGSALLGRCDELTKIKRLCEDYGMWLHVIGDLLGASALLSSTKGNIHLSCDSLTIDIMKLFGIQNLPYLTFFVRSIIDDKDLLLTTHSLHEYILHSPSISFLSVWSMSQRCSNDNVLYHMKQSFDLTNLLITRLQQIKTLRIINNDDNQEINTYQRICSGDVPKDILPKPVVIFRFQSNEQLEIEKTDDFKAYIDLLNLWLFDKLSNQYPKINLELLKSAHFQTAKSDDESLNLIPVHALRFAPLEHLIDAIEQNDMQSFLDDMQRYNDIVVATMTARINLTTIVSKYENLISIPIPNWAGIGAVRYIPSDVNPSEITAVSAYEINRIQVELARQLQTNDSAFSLGGGGGPDEPDSMFSLRLGMIRKAEDLDILLEKIFHAGKDTETSLKFVEDMAEKIKIGIEKVQKDLYDENLQLLAQEGVLRQLPLVSNIMSWWSPAPSTLPLATKGRSFDLNSGQVESTEDTYVYRMQIKKQNSHAPTHNSDETITTNSDHPVNPPEQNTDQ